MEEARKAAPRVGDVAKAVARVDENEPAARLEEEAVRRQPVADRVDGEAIQEQSASGQAETQFRWCTRMRAGCASNVRDPKGPLTVRSHPRERSGHRKHVYCPFPSPGCIVTLTP